MNSYELRLYQLDFPIAFSHCLILLDIRISTLVSPSADFCGAQIDPSSFSEPISAAIPSNLLTEGVFRTRFASPTPRFFVYDVGSGVSRKSTPSSI